LGRRPNIQDRLKNGRIAAQKKSKKRGESLPRVHTGNVGSKEAEHRRNKNWGIEEKKGASKFSGSLNGASKTKRKSVFREGT